MMVRTHYRSLCLILVCCGALCLNAPEAAAQANSTVSVKQYTLIPEAAILDSREVGEWWKEVRQVGNALQEKGEKKLRARFLSLLAEGRQKGHYVPLPDRPAQVLDSPAVFYPAGARSLKVAGTVILSVEYRADGEVGEIKVLQHLDLGLSERSVQAARQAVFLPAVKDGAFVTSHNDNVRFQFFLPKK